MQLIISVSELSPLPKNALNSILDKLAERVNSGEFDDLEQDNVSWDHQPFASFREALNVDKDVLNDMDNTVGVRISLLLISNYQVANKTTKPPMKATRAPASGSATPEPSSGSSRSSPRTAAAPKSAPPPPLTPVSTPDTSARTLRSNTTPASKPDSVEEAQESEAARRTRSQSKPPPEVADADPKEADANPASKQTGKGKRKGKGGAKPIGRPKKKTKVILPDRDVPEDELNNFNALEALEGMFIVFCLILTVFLVGYVYVGKKKDFVTWYADGKANLVLVDLPNPSEFDFGWVKDFVSPDGNIVFLPL
jgi:hypothetical protein